MILYEANMISIRVNVKPPVDRYSKIDDAEITMVDNSSVFRTAETNRWHHTDWPRPPPKLFSNFHIHVKLRRYCHRLRAKQILQELVMVSTKITQRPNLGR